MKTTKNRRVTQKLLVQIHYRIDFYCTTNGTHTRFAFHSHLIFVFPIYSFSASLGINCQSKRCPLGTRRPYGITQCCLPPGSCDIPAITPAKLLVDLATPMGCKAELTPRIDNVHDRLNAANFRDFTLSSKFVITLTIKANQISGF